VAPIALTLLLVRFFQNHGTDPADYTYTVSAEVESGQEPESIIRVNPLEYFAPYSLPETDPHTNLGFTWQADIVGDLGPVRFNVPEAYTDLGITTFRGNNFRNQAAWGSAHIMEERLEISYMLGTGRMGEWSGIGWSGQPAIVQWDFELQQQMNITPAKRDNPDLVEVIIGAMDGYIYFFDLADGVQTRPPIHLGEPIKGGVTVDPRGYPLLYVGQGVMFGARFGFYIYSLLDGTELFFLDGHDPFAPRNWGAFDGNPVFDTENDRMILAGENGVIYNILLNTAFDGTAGTVAVTPAVSRFVYTTNPHREVYGIESSVAALGHYAFFADNSGIILCLDLQAMEPVWVFDAGDDTDASLVLDWEDAHRRLVLYTGTQVDLQGPGGLAVIRKLDASNGRVLWEHAYSARHVPEVNGGVMATPVLGQGDISDLVIFAVAKTLDTGGDGVLVAFERESGEIVWEMVMPRYAWSSPVAVYTPDGTSYIIIADSGGVLFLIRGLTGEVVYQIELYGTIEGSPAVFGNQLVIGTRWQRIFGVEIL